jgi:hypothetical protein
LPLNDATDHKVFFQVVIKYSKKFHCKAFQKVPILGGLGMKYPHDQSCLSKANQTTRAYQVLSHEIGRGKGNMK